MHPLHAIILGIVEGLTEFLPISSTAHLILTSEVLRLPPTEFQKTFEIAIQFGAILAIVMLQWKRLFLSTAVWTRVLAAFIPTAVIGFALHSIIKDILFDSIPTILWSLAVGGGVLIWFSLFWKEKPGDDQKIEDISYGKAAMIGLMQAVAVVPGVSRAGATIVGGQLLGVSRRTIVEFSFLLAVPTIAAAAGYDLLKSGSVLTTQDIPMLLLGTAVSFIVAIVTVRWFLAMVQKTSFIAFGIERIVVAVLFFLWWTL